MKTKWTFLTAVVLLAALPGPSPAETAGAEPPRERRFYGFAGVGLFSPAGDIDSFDAGLAFQAGFGARVAPYAALEMTAGFMHAEEGGSSVFVVPIVFGGRLRAPFRTVEPYVGGGFGFYIANFEGFGVNDYAVDIGGYLSAGIDVYLGRRVALNIDVKRHFLEPEFDRTDIDVGGWVLAMGIRF